MRTLLYHAYTLWLFTFSDIKTIIVPKTIFAVVTLLSPSLLVTTTTNPPPTPFHVLSSIPPILLWTWLNLLPLAMNNQRSPPDVAEDKENKPWRPIPSGRISIPTTERLMIAFYTLAILTSTLYLGSLPETLFLIPGGWVYNRFGGANDSYLARNLLNAGGYMTFASGAARVGALHAKVALDEMGLLKWEVLLGMIIATTIQFQDLYDQDGDRIRGRRTMPLVLGDGWTRGSVVLAVAVWSVISPLYWRLGSMGMAMPVLLGGVVIFRVMRYRSVVADRKSFRIWNAWVMVLYLLPWLKAAAA